MRRFEISTKMRRQNGKENRETQGQGLIAWLRMNPGVSLDASDTKWLVREFLRAHSLNLSLSTYNLRLRKIVTFQAVAIAVLFWSLVGLYYRG
jgi:hypothetical protein